MLGFKACATFVQFFLHPSQSSPTPRTTPCSEIPGCLPPPPIPTEVSCSRFRLQAVCFRHEVEGDEAFLASGQGLSLPPLTAPASQRPSSWCAYPLETSQSNQLGRAITPLGQALWSFLPHSKPPQLRPEPMSGVQEGQGHTHTHQARWVRGILTAPGFGVVHPSQSPGLHHGRAHSCAGR